MAQSMMGLTKKELKKILDEKFKDEDNVGVLFSCRDFQEKGETKPVHQVLVFYEEVLKL